MICRTSSWSRRRCWTHSGRPAWRSNSAGASSASAATTRAHSNTSASSSTSAAAPERSASSSSSSASARTATSARCSPDRIALGALALVAGVPEAGLDPFVPRVTLTFTALGHAKRVIVLATGEGKADADRRRVLRRRSAHARTSPRRCWSSTSMTSSCCSTSRQPRVYDDRRRDRRRRHQVAATLLGPDGMGELRQQPTKLESGEALIDQLVEIVGEAAGRRVL